MNITSKLYKRIGQQKANLDAFDFEKEADENGVLRQSKRLKKKEDSPRKKKER